MSLGELEQVFPSIFAAPDDGGYNLANRSSDSLLLLKPAEEFLRRQGTWAGLSEDTRTG